MTLKERCKKLIAYFDLPVTRFCRKIGISPQAYYRWQKGELNLSENTEKNIDRFLMENNF